MPALFTRSYLAFVYLFLQDNAGLSVIEQQEDQIRRTLLFALIPVVVAFSFFVFVFYRSRREAFFKQKEAELKLAIVEEELKALRAQINPHFIFNCLNSIHHCMQTNQTLAGDYLLRFSHLIRYALESSEIRTVALADEINANKSYLQLEQLRLNHSFEFVFHTDGMDVDAVHIPPMLIQPFVENSIWHGLSQRGAGGRLDIYFSMKDDRHLQCIIKDNGTTSEKSEFDLSHKIKKTSMGMALIQNRLDTLNSLYQSNAGFVIQPNGHEGKSLILTMPYED